MSPGYAGWVGKLKLILFASALSLAAAAPDACAASIANHGCSAFCGYEAVKAADDWICLQSKSRLPFPFATSKADVEELCQMVAADHGCCDTCGFRFDAGECRPVGSKPAESKPLGADPIIGGSGDFRYQYMPDLLKPPAGATLVNCHGLAVDKDQNIILTYQNDGKTDPHCLIKWNPDGTGGAFASKDTPGLCSGTPHGLKITTEKDGQQFLFHANNAQR